MAQALLNNLNITQETGISMNEKNMPAETNFAQILDCKTAKEDIDNQVQTTEHVIQPVVSMEIEQNQDIETDNNIIMEECAQAIQESAIETVIDLTIVKENFLEAVENIEVQTENSLELAESSIEQDNISDNDEKNENNEIAENITTQIPNITEEEPTMYKELNTLENPTVSLLMHSQMHTAVSVSAEKSDSQEMLNNEKSLQMQNANSSFKQQDSLSLKDTPSSVYNAVKDTSEIKAENHKINNVIDEEVVKDLNIKSVNYESSENESSNNFMQNQTPQEQAAKVMIQGDIKYESISSETLKPEVNIKPIDISPSKIVEQISKQLDGMYNNSKLNIVLNPDSLGKVNLQIINSKDGLIAQFTVTTQEAKDILMKGLDGLKNSLLAQGINVDNVSVKLEESDGEYNFDWTEQEGSRGGNKQQGARKQKEEEKTFEDIIGMSIEESNSEN